MQILTTMLKWVLGFRVWGLIRIILFFPISLLFVAYFRQRKARKLYRVTEEYNPQTHVIMASKKDILKKIRILITQKFENPVEAFNFFDKNGDGFLTRAELKELVKQAEVSRFLSGIVASKMLDGLDEDKNEKFNWREFKKAVNKLIVEA